MSNWKIIVPSVVVSGAVAFTVACSGQDPVADDVVTGSEDLSGLKALPELPLRGVADYEFRQIDEQGNVTSDSDLPVTITGGGATRDLAFDLFTKQVITTVDADGTQPDADQEQNPLVYVLGALPVAGTRPTARSTWSYPQPSAMVSSLGQLGLQGVTVTRPDFSGAIEGVARLSSPAGFAIVRAALTVRQWSPSATSSAARSNVVSVGVADIAVSMRAPRFMVPLRIAYLSQTGAMLADGATWAALEKQPHTAAVYCLDSLDGVPQSLLASIPTLSRAAYPAELSRCVSP